jgi:hypothetical protein
MALITPPSVKPATSGKCAMTPEIGIAWLRVTSAKDNVARLMSRLSGMAARAGKPMTCVSHRQSELAAAQADQAGKSADGHGVQE